MSINLPSISPVQRSETSTSRRQPNGQPIRRPFVVHKPLPSQKSPGKGPGKTQDREA